MTPRRNQWSEADVGGLLSFLPSHDTFTSSFPLLSHVDIVGTLAGYEFGAVLSHAAASRPGRRRTLGLCRARETPVGKAYESLLFVDPEGKPDRRTAAAVGSLATDQGLGTSRSDVLIYDIR
jgi:hypothetical protein